MKTYCLVILCLIIISKLSFAQSQQVGNGQLHLKFLNTVGGKEIVLHDSNYINAFNESYSIRKLKYYIGQVSVTGSKPVEREDPYQLINAALPENIISLSLPPGKYGDISFLLGVDSARHCSGAQTGALDPINDMFWTWNSGYVIFKLDGNSTSSSADLQRIELHVGGYKGENNVSRMIDLPIQDEKTFTIRENGVTEILIEMNLDHFWKGKQEIRISESAVCTTTGALANRMADNFKGLFSIKSISVK